MNSKTTSALFWSTLILALGCIAYVIWSQWLFLAIGLLGFVLIMTAKK